ncbi:ATP-binding protein [Vibrio panuliri]|uniref:histidine kinase n=1 Tax=Vibrio panuliri TaxID=1381081 RepID=A0ABX3FQ91_9VIBR|nr:sensor histidine kinase [Vibrio panuliri]KAB1454521.1 sensor histidine kinase [Vibrio panuliri]OLQ94952.1 histidine kinase [Vibrio panuliri]
MGWSGMSFRKRMLAIMTFSGLVELLVLVAAGFLYIKYSQEQEVGQKALGVASFLSQSPAVLEIIQQGGTQDQAKYRELSQMIGAAFIVIGDRQGIRLVHPIDERIGKPMKGGDNARALTFGESYVSFAQGSLGYSVRGKTAIFDPNGQIVGVVSVGYLVDRLQDRIEPFLIYLLVMTLIVLTANAVISNFAARRFQKAILGFEPEEIARLYVELDVTLATLKEGIIAIDAHGRLRSINKSACQILGVEKEHCINRLLSEVLPDSELQNLLTTPRVDKDINLYLNGQRLIANRSPIVVEGEVVGAVSSFRLRDEITELTEQLSKTKEYAEMLRSQTHEHRNKLSTISGMVQLGEVEAVQAFIGQETAHYQSLMESLRETIDEPLIAGLLLGKTERARELGLNLELEAGSRLAPLPAKINPEDVVTILGNMIDNAFDSVRSAISLQADFEPSRRQIDVSLTDYGNEIILEVSDQGVGLPQELSPEALVEMGVSSKADEGRGVGLYLINQSIVRYNGQIELFNNDDFGARVTVYLPKEGMQ